eukprot:3698607-Prymnesium_polylepis.1
MRRKVGRVAARTCLEGFLAFVVDATEKVCLDARSVEHPVEGDNDSHVHPSEGLSRRGHPARPLLRIFLEPLARREVRGCGEQLRRRAVRGRHGVLYRFCQIEQL